ncbi:rab-GTPase-TBC domain-containing protein, partial [Syncephalis plumigaleata]
MYISNSHIIPIAYYYSCRPQVWLECSGAYNIRQSGYYQRLLDTNTDKSSTFMTQIELDVHRTMPDNIFFGGDGPGVCKLRRVLTAYSWHNPTIGYCQGMNVMAATLLLVFPTSEENAFWTLVYLMEHIIPEGYHSHQLMELCRDTAPQLAGHLKACGVDMAAITISCMPLEVSDRASYTMNMK